MVWEIALLWTPAEIPKTWLTFLRLILSLSAFHARMYLTQIFPSLRPNHSSTQPYWARLSWNDSSVDPQERLAWPTGKRCILAPTTRGSNDVNVAFSLFSYQPSCSHKLWEECQAPGFLEFPFVAWFQVGRKHPLPLPQGGVGQEAHTLTTSPKIQRKPRHKTVTRCSFSKSFTVDLTLLWLLSVNGIYSFFLDLWGLCLHWYRKHSVLEF